jgi:hypothetical protein
MFEADEINATHVGFARRAPSIDGLYEGPSDGAPLLVRDRSTVRPRFHGVPRSLTGFARKITNTSFAPFRSLDTRFDASDSNAIARTKRLSFDITAFVEAPFGAPPPLEREMSSVDVVRAVVTLASGWANAATPPEARTASTTGAATCRKRAGKFGFKGGTRRVAPLVRQVLARP